MPAQQQAETVTKPAADNNNFQPAKPVASPLKKPLTKNNIKKIPGKYMTAQQEEDLMEDEIEDLLNFTNNLD